MMCMFVYSTTQYIYLYHRMISWRKIGNLKCHFYPFYEKCDEQYIDVKYKWCRTCRINVLKANFKNWTSRNEQIDKFIQEKQLKIDYPNNIVFEWIPYNQ